MVLLNTAHVRPGSVIGSPLQDPPGGEVGFPRPTRSGTRRRTSGLRVLSRDVPLYQACSRRAQILREGTGWVPACDFPRTPLPSRQVPYRSKCTMLLPTPLHSLVPVGRFLRGLPPPPRSLTANIVPTVPVYVHPTLWRRRTVVPSLVLSP